MRGNPRCALFGEVMAEARKDGVSAQETAKGIDEQDLERLAVESLLEDVKRRKNRVERVGTMGWVKERNVNKRFLNSLVLQTVPRRSTSKGDRSGQKSQEPAIEEARHSSHHRPTDGDRDSGSSGSRRRREESERQHTDYYRSRDHHHHKSSHSREHSPHHHSRERYRDRRSREERKMSKGSGSLQQPQ